MEVLQPETWEEALAIKAERPEAVPLQGGTDVMVELNFDRSRPDAIVDLTRVQALQEWWREDGTVRLGAGVTYARVIAELHRELPGLAIASRTVGSPPIRNRGTVGGNLGSASPAGDSHPPLLASDAEVEVASARGTRRVPIRDFFTAPKRNVLKPDELIAAARVPVATGPQQYSKVGPRNAMVIAVCCLGVSLDPERRRVGAAIGSAAPTPVRAGEAERFLEGVLEERGLWDSGGPLTGAELERFGRLVAQAARPIDDVRGTARYRVHALGVLARRTLGWAWAEYRGE